MVAINNDLADIPSVNFSLQGSDISAPGAARAQLYVKSSGVWYILNGGTATRLADNPLTTAGDLIVSGASGAPTRLAKGNDADVLTIDPATHLPVWAAPAGGGSSYARVSAPTNANQSANNFHDVTWATEDADSGTIVDLGSNASTLTIPKTGLYLLSAYVLYTTNNTTGTRGLYFVKNTDTYVMQKLQGYAAYIGSEVDINGIFQLTAGDTVRCQIYHTAGATMGLTDGFFALVGLN